MQSVVEIKEPWKSKLANLKASIAILDEEDLKARGLIQRLGDQKNTTTATFKAMAEGAAIAIGIPEGVHFTLADDCGSFLQTMPETKGVIDGATDCGTVA